jgi:2'-hydroxyisoflavone reductase
MRILILGGTSFVGRHFTEESLKRGFDVTLFNRGKTNTELYPEVEKLIGDRDGNLESVKGKQWDIVIDTSGYVPRVVEQSIEALKGNIGHYVFISSISVYRDFREGRRAEGDPVGKLENERIEEVTGETYGPLKALCEEVVTSELPDKNLIIRPGLIVGPYDTTDRFTYWVDRFSRGGEILVPGTGTREVQWVDVRDLVTWTLNMAEKKETGTYNVTGPSEHYTMGELIDTLDKWTSTHSTKIDWVGSDFLIEQGVQPFTELPLWVPINDEYPAGYILADILKATNKGLTFRRPVETIEDIWQWHNARDVQDLKAGLDHNKETSLLHEWKRRNEKKE